MEHFDYFISILGERLAVGIAIKDGQSIRRILKIKDSQTDESLTPNRRDIVIETDHVEIGRRENPEITGQNVKDWDSV